MADVITKCIAANSIREASVVCYVTKGGHKQVLRPDFEKQVSTQAIEDRLTHKFDEINYYSN